MMLRFKFYKHSADIHNILRLVSIFMILIIYYNNARKMPPWMEKGPIREEKANRVLSCHARHLVKFKFGSVYTYVLFEIFHISWKLNRTVSSILIPLWHWWISGRLLKVPHRCFAVPARRADIVDTRALHVFHAWDQPRLRHSYR